MLPTRVFIPFDCIFEEATDEILVVCFESVLLALPPADEIVCRRFDAGGRFDLLMLLKPVILAFGLARFDYRPELCFATSWRSKSENSFSVVMFLCGSLSLLLAYPCLIF